MPLMPLKIEIILNHLPYKELSPNSRVHYMVKAKAVKALRKEAGWLAKDAWGDRTPIMSARVSYHFYVRHHRHMDIDNLIASMKSSLDGLVDGGLIMSDDVEHLELGQCTVTQSVQEQTIIRVEILLR